MNKMQKSHNILIVEDDSNLLHMTSRTLKKEGYTVDIAENAQQCLEKIAGFQPDFIIVDYGLPDQTGAELIDKIYKELPGKLPGILVMSGFRGDDAFINKILDKGAIDFIRKPFKGKELVRRVNAYFKIRNLENKRLSLLKEYSAVLDLSGEIVFHIDKNLKFTHLNNAFETLTKHKVEIWLGKSPKKLIHEPDWDILEENFKKVLSGNEVPLFEVRLTRPDDSKFPLSLRLALLSSENGEKSVLGVGQDLSNLKWLNEGLSDNKQEKIRENNTSDFNQNVKVKVREIQPNILKEAQESYSRLVGKSVENRIYKLDQDISSELSSLGKLLGSNYATPKHIISLHIEFLKKFTNNITSRKTEIMSEESRLILLKLMGNLAMYYKNECVKN